MARRTAGRVRSGEPVVSGEPRVDIDLRDAGSAPVAPPPRDAPAEVRLASLLELPSIAAETLLDALLDVADAGGTIHDLVPADGRAGHWVRLLDHFAATKGRRAYIGSFRVALAQAAELSMEVPERERAVAALLVLDRATADATTEDELRHGVVVAMRVRPGTIVPGTAIETIVRLALRHHTPQRRLAVELALPVALDLMAQSRDACFHPRDIWTLRAAVAVLTQEQRERVLVRAQHLHREDRKVVESLIRPAEPPRAGRLQRRRR